MILIHVTGMTCGHCAMSVKKALSAVPGVESAEVDQPSGRARVEGKPDPQALLAAIAEEGYGARLA